MATINVAAVYVVSACIKNISVSIALYRNNNGMAAKWRSSERRRRNGGISEGDHQICRYHQHGWRKHQSRQWRRKASAMAAAPALNVLLYVCRDVSNVMRISCCSVHMRSAGQRAALITLINNKRARVSRSSYDDMSLINNRRILAYPLASPCNISTRQNISRVPAAAAYLILTANNI